MLLIVTVLLVLYLISIIAKFAWQFFPEEQNRLSSGSAAVSAFESENRDNGLETNLDALLNLNLFGAIEQAPPEPVEEDITDAPETSLNMLLSGVVASTEKDKGAAVIAFRNIQGSYSVGDQIEGTSVTLEQIYFDRVIIKNRAVRETLMLEGVDFEEANRSRARDRQPVPTSQNRNAENRNAQVRAREVKAQILQQPESFTDFIRMAPTQNETGLVGYRLTAGNKYPELFTTLGLQNGDIATMLNGLDLTNPQEALEAVSLLQSEEELTIEIIRDDELVSVLVEIPQG
ncbi:MAG: type II secretion system protein GspC [Pseudomonadota bacterium]